MGGKALLVIPSGCGARRGALGLFSSSCRSSAPLRISASVFFTGPAGLAGTAAGGGGTTVFFSGASGEGTRGVVPAFFFGAGSSISDNTFFAAGFFGADASLLTSEEALVVVFDELDLEGMSEIEERRARVNEALESR